MSGGMTAQRDHTAQTGSNKPRPQDSETVGVDEQELRSNRDRGSTLAIYRKIE